jgi:hypothetical protein
MVTNAVGTVKYPTCSSRDADSSDTDAAGARESAGGCLNGCTSLSLVAAHSARRSS